MPLKVIFCSFQTVSTCKVQCFYHFIIKPERILIVYFDLFVGFKGTADPVGGK